MKTKTKLITLSKGGTLERTLPVNQIIIPDLYRIAQSLRYDCPEAADAILEVWHLAHDLKNAIEHES